MEYNNLIAQKITDTIKIYNCDNMELMAQTPDKYYDLAIVDPPYGIMKQTNKHLRKAKMGKLLWDITPNDNYFKELFRVSKNQLIFGGNYFNLVYPKSVIFWDKLNYFPLFGDGELCYYYGKLKSMKEIKRNLGGIIKVVINQKAKKIHPTQKPVDLYKWLLHNYAKEGDKILDTHLGSGSIAIACHDYKFNLTACELNVDYYEASIKRIKAHVSQLQMF